MTATPIERVKSWWSGLATRCAHCKAEATFRSAGGYRYCSTQCETADAADYAHTL